MNAGSICDQRNIHAVIHDAANIKRNNFLNNMMGVVAPVTTGYIVGATGSFVGAFLAAGVVLVIGIGAYIFILGPLEPIADLQAA